MSTDMAFKAEKEMQSAFSKWICTEAGESWVMAENHGVMAAAFELKHVRCDRKASARKPCAPGKCASRLRIGEHEMAQADGLAVSEGAGAMRGRRAWCHKLPDIGAGYRPVDCVVLGRGALARFVMGWSCGAAGASRAFRAYAVPWRVVAGWIAGGTASVTEEMARGAGVALPWKG